MSREGIILAAGLSSRAKTFKMLLPLNGKSVIENTIDNMLQFSQRVIVVGGYKIELLQPIIQKYRNVELIFNENYEEGMFSSVKCGIKAVREDEFFFTPGDYPLISKDVYSKILSKTGDIIIPTYKGRKGHPILIKSKFIKEILQEGKYETLRDFINIQNPKFIEVNHKEILMDIDTIEDYKKALKNLGED